PVVKLDKADPLLYQPARQQAIVGKARGAGLGAVHIEHLARFAGYVHDLRHGCLHAERQLGLGDARARLVVAELAGLNLVPAAQGVEAERAHGAVHAARIGDVQDGISLRPTLHALVHAWQKAAGPIAVAGAWKDAAGDQNDETG